uniref:Nibrin n=2 Tax=Brachionus koreanus TaxID=1199090 RepID=A0A7G7WNH7_9BILA|nr:nibrin [Brachionus koreanus]
MVWYLKSRQSDKRTKILLCNKKYKIGRLMPNAEVDIKIDSDQTVSRLHAELLIKYDQDQCSDLDSLPSIVLTDNSKFGTFINNKKIDGFKALKQNDIIRFGAYNSIYQLCYEPLIVTTSCLTIENKRKVCHLVAKLGGHLVQDWTNDCELVIMDSITVTVKVIDALISQKRIVTVQYLEEIINSEDLPDPRDFRPEIGEEIPDSEVISFEPNSNRRILFKEKKFVFQSDKQLHKFQNIIELASGKCQLFDKAIHLNKSVLNEKRVLLIRNDSSDSQLNSAQLQIENFLHLLGLKLIDESEIGLAVLHANLDKYCNPVKEIEITDKIKVASQTLTDTCFRNNYPEGFDTQQTDMDNQSQDSCLFQFEKKAEDLFIVSDTPEPARKRPVEQQSFVETKKKSPQVKIQTGESILMNNKKYLSVENSIVKKEPKIKKENNTFSHRIHETSLVYSKLNPPTNAKQYQLSQSSTIKPSAQIVVKYEPLIRSRTCSSFESSNWNGKKNFKKFKKIPKAIKKENQSLFKSFKQEEFNVDSQFEMFMSSNK